MKSGKFFSRAAKKQFFVTLISPLRWLMGSAVWRNEISVRFLARESRTRRKAATNHGEAHSTAHFRQQWRGISIMHAEPLWNSAPTPAHTAEIFSEERLVTPRLWYTWSERETRDESPICGVLSVAMKQHTCHARSKIDDCLLIYQFYSSSLSFSVRFRAERLSDRRVMSRRNYYNAWAD
jgi:hypothetical protein